MIQEGYDVRFAVAKCIIFPCSFQQQPFAFPTITNLPITFFPQTSTTNGQPILPTTNGQPNTMTTTTSGQPNSVNPGNMIYINGRPFTVLQPNGFPTIPTTNTNTVFPNTNTGFPNTGQPNTNTGLPNTNTVFFPNNGFPNTNALFFPNTNGNTGFPGTNTFSTSSTTQG